MSDFTPDTNFVFKGALSEPSTTLDFKLNNNTPVAYIPSADFNLTGQQGVPSANFDFGESESEVTALYPIGFNQAQYGYPALSTGTAVIAPTGVFAPTPPSPTIINSAEQVLVPGINTGYAYGIPLIYNLITISKPTGINQSALGVAYVQGGTKTVSPRGYDAALYGKTFALNTTADRAIYVSGINQLVVPAPLVTPTIVYAKGWKSLLVGGHAIGEAPKIAPQGEIQTQWGSTTTWYSIRAIGGATGVGGIDSYGTGYPSVYDLKQEVQVQSVISSSIFGDTAIRNNRRFLQPTAIFDGVVEQWAILTNSNRYLEPKGFSLQGFGDSYTYNKTPSILLNGIDSLTMGVTDIGYTIRTVVPTGFDRLLLGRPTLTKTPELAPKSFASSKVSSVFISHGIRTLEVMGLNSQELGKHTAWFRYRYVAGTPWLSSKFGTTNLSHGVRELIAQGFVREVHGRAWISQGTRWLEPVGINKVHPSLHMIGGSREIKPAGYIATLFGTRIIPENTYAYPQGFAGKWGLTDVKLGTRYLGAIGFISVGQQPADRWGNAAAFNSVQYIVQEQSFDRDNGLIPPAWSDWTLIENRNKQLNTTGLNATRFGYNYIDNNATPLLPLGIEPPVCTRDDVSMIAHGVRYLSFDGIDSTIVSDWGVAFNGARVIAPQGGVNTSVGLASVVATRRYYSGVGRIDSQEFGEPMISYAVRTIDIETRYSISPPQISLPTIDTWTKYVDLAGYEVGGYGTASLSIHFNIIKPNWVHRDKFGEHYARNLTPELGLYGHDSQEFGVAAIRTQWRNVQAWGDTLTLFGRARIADRKQDIIVRGWRDTVVAQKHTVIKSGAPLYSVQQISLDGWFDFDTDKAVAGFGIDSEETVRSGSYLRVPKPSINQNVLYPDGYIATLFGENKIHTNVIQIVTGIAIHNISVNTVVSNKSRQLILGAEETIIKSEVTFGKPRLSPHTIYSTTEALEQAINNHPHGGNRHVVDGLRDNYKGLEVFGRPRVDSTIRTIYPKWSNISIKDKISEPVVTLKTRVIKPLSFRRSMFGIPGMPFTLQRVTMFDKGEPMSLYGKPDIKHSEYGPKFIGVAGNNLLKVGATQIDFKVRMLAASGHNSLVMGTKKNNDKPYMWQGLRVGAQVPNIVGGDDMSEFGSSMVSLRIRGLALDGWDSFISEYDTANFKERMKVSFVDKPIIFETQRITVGGFIASNHGYAAGIKFGQQFIRPDGNSDQFRKGGYHA